MRYGSWKRAKLISNKFSRWELKSGKVKHEISWDSSHFHFQSIFFAPAHFAGSTNNCNHHVELQINLWPTSIERIVANAPHRQIVGFRSDDQRLFESQQQPPSWHGRKHEYATDNWFFLTYSLIWLDLNEIFKIIQLLLLLETVNKKYMCHISWLFCVTFLRLVD